MQAAINNNNPIVPAVLNLVDRCKNPSPPPPLSNPNYNFGHCYAPTDFPLLPDFPQEDGKEMLDFLANYILSSQPPLSLTIRTDESKPYYWLNIAQTGGDHWTSVQASYNLANQTITATMVDTATLNLGFNVGSTPLPGSAGLLQPGMGFPAGNYVVNIEGANTVGYTQTYVSGYFTVTLSNAGQSSLTISLSNPIGPNSSVYLPIVVK
jgi:hypothetical protein